MLNTPTRLANDFFGFAPELRTGFWVASADVDGDGFADVLLAAGDGGAPRVVVYSGKILATGGGSVAIQSFFAGDPATRAGARIATENLTGTARPFLISAGGAGVLPIVSIYDPATGTLKDLFLGFPTNSTTGQSIG